MTPPPRPTPMVIPGSSSPLLYTAAAGKGYERGQLAVLRRDLEASSRSTSLVELCDREQLQLGADGRTASGYRLTQTALRHVGNAMLPGLYTMMVELSGLHRDPSDPPEAYSERDALLLYNAVLERRFSSRLTDRYCLVVDRANRTIDGLIGRGFRFLSHLDLLTAAEDALAEAGRPFTLLEAVLGDRRLSMRWVGTGRLLADADGKPWFGGAHFVNSELGGEQAVSGSVLLVQPRSNLHALRSCRLGRTAHVGRGFDDRLKGLLAATLAAWPTEAYEAQFKAVAGRRIDVPVDRIPREEALAWLARELSRRGLPRSLATKVVMAALHGVTDTTILGLACVPYRTPASVTALAIYKATSAMAQSRGQVVRERLERVAWTLLTTPLHPKRRVPGKRPSPSGDGFATQP